MQTRGTKHLHESHKNTVLSQDEIYLGIINNWLHLFFYENYPATASKSQSSSCYDLHHFTASAEELLRSNSGKAHTMLVFDCDITGGSYDQAADNELTLYLSGLLQSHLAKRHLFCRLHDDTFLILLEDCKEIDIAVFVICLMEEISGRYPDQRAKLSVGTCKADPAEYNVHCLYQKAAYAKNTIKGQGHQLLADYHELVTKHTAKA